MKESAVEGHAVENHAERSAPGMSQRTFVTLEGMLDEARRYGHAVEVYSRRAARLDPSERRRLLLNALADGQGRLQRLVELTRNDLEQFRRDRFFQAIPAPPRFLFEKDLATPEAFEEFLVVVQTLNDLWVRTFTEMGEQSSSETRLGQVLLALAQGIHRVERGFSQDQLSAWDL
jgi:hypothetical protein